MYSQQKAPPTEEELQAMIKKIQRQSDSIQNVLKKKLPADRDKNLATGTGGTHIPKAGGDPDIEKIKLPPKDSARIKTIPQRDLTSAELNSYLKSLHDQLKKLLPADAVASANAIAEKLKHPLKIENAAVIAWQNGSFEESVLLITDAATKLPTDGDLLSNTGAILDMCGLGEKAIPILRIVVRIDPEHAAAHNNLGQAYTGLGMQDSALHYFSRCLSLSPQHPEANNTAGVIELQKGNNAKAQMHFENSIRGSFNVSAYKGLKRLLKDKCRITPLVKPKVKLPEYFNQFKYKLPRQCLNIYEAAARKQEQKVFRERMSALIRAFQKLEKEAEKELAKKSPAQFNKEIMDKAMKGQPVVRPFQVLGGIMEAEAILDYQKDRDELQKFNKENRKAYKDLEQEYKDAYEKLMKDLQPKDDENCCGEGDVSCCETGFCAASNELKNKYLPRFAQLNEEWQSRNMLVEKTYLDDLLYWGYFAAFNKDDFRVRFFQRVVNYLKVVASIDEIKILEPCKEKEIEDDEARSDSIATKEAPDCPISVSIRFWIGKLEGDCDKILFKAGEGIKFRIERNFVLRQTTISLGAGYEFFNALDGGLEAEGTVSAYITFDKDNVPSDGGLLASAKIKAGVGFESGQKLKFKEGVSVRAGISSGVSFEPGLLKPLWDKIKPAPEVPVPANKNIKPYKANQ
jgi:tetratricopeptide (TPR) repeat protein